MNATASPQPAKPTTAIFMRAALPSIDEGQILVCPSCMKATVPFPDPQRTPALSHCYRCGAEYHVKTCGQCGAAKLIGPEGGLGEDASTCPECAG
jgi:hypothetical protein